MTRDEIFLHTVVRCAPNLRRMHMQAWTRGDWVTLSLVIQERHTLVRGLAEVLRRRRREVDSVKPSC